VLPTNQYPDIIQQGVIISSTKKRASAQQLMQFLMAEATQKQLIKLGYRIKDNNASK
jgi:molybdate transport system substrate-binding protein